MATTLTEFFNRPWTKIISSYLLVLVLGVGLGVWGTLRWQTPSLPDITVVGPVKYVEVPVEVLKPGKDIIKYVRDTKEVNKLLMEAAAAENKIQTLTETIARLQTTTVAPPEVKTVFVETPGAPEAHFKDWRLTFDATKDGTTYKLDQKLETLSALGKTKDGKPYVNVKLFEIGPGETRTQLSETTTTAILAIPNPKRWFVNGAIQAGFAYATDTSGKGTSGGIVGLQWLKRGYSKAAEDGIWSVATPAAFITTGGVEPALLPVSFNVGRLPKQPFKDLWVSPTIVFGVPEDLTTATNPNSLLKSAKFGVTLTATF